MSIIVFSMQALYLTENVQRCFSISRKYWERKKLHFLLSTFLFQGLLWCLGWGMLFFLEHIDICKFRNQDSDVMQLNNPSLQLQRSSIYSMPGFLETLLVHDKLLDFLIYYWMRHAFVFADETLCHVNIFLWSDWWKQEECQLTTDVSRNRLSKSWGSNSFQLVLVIWLIS